MEIKISGCMQANECDILTISGRKRKAIVKKIKSTDTHAYTITVKPLSKWSLIRFFQLAIFYVVFFITWNFDDKHQP